jgi:hypothetical protein
VDVSEFQKGNISQNDMLRAHINWSTGFIPGYGAIPAGFQLAVDTDFIDYEE